MSPARDTIVAIATAPGRGGIGIVRLSGPDAVRIANSLGAGRLAPRRARAVRLRDAGGATLDRGVALWFRAPKSYTGEDVVELQVHGSPPVLALIQARCLELGARPARPGEFSERAFLEGRIDLAQAEAVADLVAAGSEAQARAALRSLEGEFSERVASVQRDLTRLRVQIEAGLDFPEEELDLEGEAALARNLDALGGALTELRAAALRGQRLRDGLHVVIVGAPNAGKSSLLNALAGSERAIVTPIPGTTRDLLHQAVNLDGVEITLVDTAGLRHSDDPIEQEGVRRAEAERARADLELEVRDDVGNRAVPVADVGVARIVVHSKCDLGSEPAREEWHGGDVARTRHIWLSARTGAGLPLLRAALAAHAGGSEAGTGAFSARARHVAALARAAAHLEAAAAEAGQGRAELLAEELRQTQRALDELTGHHGSDELLGEIFASFCIGK